MSQEYDISFETSKTAARGRAPVERIVPGWLPALLTLEGDDLAQQCVHVLPEIFGYSAGTVYFPDTEFTRLRCGATSQGVSPDSQIPIEPEALDPRSWAALRRRRIRVSDANETCRMRGWRLPEHMRGTRPIRWLLQPLVCDGLLCGLLEFSAGAECPGPPPRPPSNLVELLGRIFGNAARFHAVRLEARQDALTGLYNRRAFHEELTREIAAAQRDSVPLALLMLDLDGLKQINDTHGHQAGDAVLRSMAATLRSALRSGDLPARIGGDEFAALLPRTTQAAAEKLLEKVRASFAVAQPGPNLISSVSVGLSVWRKGWTLQQLLASADQALYAGKPPRRSPSYEKSIAGDFSGSPDRFYHERQSGT